MVERWHRRARVLRSLGQLADFIGAAPVRGELAAATLRDVAAIATRSLHRESRAAEAQLCGAGVGLDGIWVWRPLRGPLVGRLLGGVPCFGSWERPCPPAQTRWSEYGLRAEIVSSRQGRQLLKKWMTIHFFSIQMSSVPVSFVPARIRRQLRGVRRAVNLTSLKRG